MKTKMCYNITICIISYKSGGKYLRLSKLFQEKECVFSIEVFPPKKNGATPEQLYPVLKELAKLSPDYISVTYGAGGGAAGMSTVQIASHLKHELGIEPLAHLTCVNSTHQQVEFMAQQLKENNIENLLALRGDICPDLPRQTDFTHASDLAKQLKSIHDFYLAGACYPEGHVECDTLRQDVENLKYKLQAGVEHLVTQLFFDNACYYRFMNRARKSGIDVPIQAGVMPIVSARQVQRTVALSSASLPPRFTKMLSCYDHDEKALFDAGIEYAIEQLRDLIESGADGVHLYAMNNPEVARRVYEGIYDLLPERKQA